MHVSHAGTSELAIFSRVLAPDQATLSAAAARAILHLSFSHADKDRMRQLSANRKSCFGRCDRSAPADFSHKAEHWGDWTALELFLSGLIDWK